MNQLFSDYELFYFNLSEVQKNLENTITNIIILNNNESMMSIDFKKLSNNFLILSEMKNHNSNIKNQLIKTPISINQINDAYLGKFSNFKKKL